MTPRPSARRTTTPAEMAFATMFGIAPRLATVLADLQTGKPTPALRVHICALRRALPTEAIDTMNAGYILTDIGQQACAEAVADFVAWVGMTERAA